LIDVFRGRLTLPWTRKAVKEASRNPLQAIRRLKLVGFAVVVLVVGGADEWAATSRVQGAVIASGTLVVELNITTLFEGI
jgi:hypothetical protein